MGDLHERSLVRLAKKCEEVADGLRNFRDNLPRYANGITGSVGKLYDISSQLNEIDQAQGDQRYAANFSLIQNDLAVLRPTLDGTLDAVFEMFGDTKDSPYTKVWESFEYRMDEQEGVGLFLRLGWYQDFLKALFEVVTALAGDDPSDLRRALVQLTERQDDAARRARRRSADVSGNGGLASKVDALSDRVVASVTPRPNQGRPRVSRRTTPRSPTSSEGSYRPEFPPLAPDPPQTVPLSPTFTSSSSQTLNSSRTSYGSDFMPPQPALVHWASRIFDGQHAESTFSAPWQMSNSSKCYDTPEYGLLDHLLAKGYMQALEMRSFNQRNMTVGFYYKPSNSRAYIVISTRDRHGRDEKQYCELLTQLKAIRNGSILQLCKPGRGSAYEVWAKLNFYIYERMVLFYCTFAAMKRQDSQAVSSEALLDTFGLRGPEKLEELEYAGQVRDDDMVHLLRLWRDRASGVFRLEACALRGPMKDVPLWTAFITKYAVDPDHVQREDRRIVSLAALKPKPYVFLAGYRPPMNAQGEYIFHFLSSEDASQFMETWAGLRRQI